MGVSLTKGGNVSLTKEAPGLTNVLVGLGWDVRTTTGADFDLDASAIMVNATGKVISDQHFVFFNNLMSPDGTVEHTGDNLTGEGEGDDEIIKVNLAAVPAEVEKIVFPVTIYDADARRQSFGQVRNAFIRVVNADNDAELTRYDLTEDASTETAMVFGELYRNGAEWKFRAVGQGYASGLRGHRPGLRRQRLSSLDDGGHVLRGAARLGRVGEQGVQHRHEAVVGARDAQGLADEAAVLQRAVHRERGRVLARDHGAALELDVGRVHRAARDRVEEDLRVQPEPFRERDALRGARDDGQHPGVGHQLQPVGRARLLADPDRLARRSRRTPGSRWRAGRSGPRPAR